MPGMPPRRHPRGPQPTPRSKSDDNAETSHSTRNRGAGPCRDRHRPPVHAASQKVADCSFATLKADLQAGGDYYYVKGQCSSLSRLTAPSRSAATRASRLRKRHHHLRRWVSVPGSVDLGELRGELRPDRPHPVGWSAGYVGVAQSTTPAH
jgi:hypothetical protein